MTPPQPEVTAEKGEPVRSEPPGGIEMPAGEIPPHSNQDPPKSDAGIEMPEMPKGTEVPDAGSASDGEATPMDSDASASVDLRYGTWEEIQQVAKSSGRVTVVDLWSLACEPCLKEFPGLVRLHQTRGTSVQCIAVDIDFDGRQSRPPKHYETQVASFLRGVDAFGFPAYICRTPSDDVFAATTLVSIPAVVIYNREGEVAKVFVDAGETAGFTYEDDVIPWVDKLVGGAT